MTAPFHLAVALDGAGFHPAAWRDPSARPRDLFTARYWTDVALRAERGLLDEIASIRASTDPPTRQALKIARANHHAVLSWSDNSTASTTEADRMASMTTAETSRTTDT